MRLWDQNVFYYKICITGTITQYNVEEIMCSGYLYPLIHWMRNESTEILYGCMHSCPILHNAEYILHVEQREEDEALDALQNVSTKGCQELGQDSRKNFFAPPPK